jgi:hypothetical protein
MGYKEIPLSELDAQQYGPVWVLNSAMKSRVKLPGNVVVNIPDPNGKEGYALCVPMSWLPVNVAEAVPRQRLLASTQFRTAVTKGLLTVISEDDATRILRQDGADEERERLEAVDEAVAAAGAARDITKSNVEIFRTDRKAGEDDDDDGPVESYANFDPSSGQGGVNMGKAAKAGVELDANGLMPSFVMFVDKLKTESDMGALNAIRARSKFTRRELKYMARQLKGHLKTHASLVARIEKFKAKK